MSRQKEKLGKDEHRNNTGLMNMRQNGPHWDLESQISTLSRGILLAMGKSLDFIAGEKGGLQ